MENLLAQIGQALAPTLTVLAGQVGVTVAIYRPTSAQSNSGVWRRTYGAPDTAWAEAAAFFGPGNDDNAQGATDATLKPFGVRTSDRGSFTFVPNASGVLPLIAFGDGFKILSGPFMGFTWVAEAPSVPDLLGTTCTVAVVSAPAGAIV